MLSLLLSLVMTAAATSPALWPDLNVPPDGIDLFRALEGRTLYGRDAVSVFLALVRPGQYRVRAVNRDFDFKLITEPMDRNEVDIRILMSHAGLELGRTFLLHTGKKPPPGFGRFELKTMAYGDAPALRLSLTPDNGEATIMRVRFQSGVRRIRSLGLSGPTLDRFRALAPRHLTGARMDFQFEDWRPPTGLELNCRKLLHRLESQTTD